MLNNDWQIYIHLCTKGEATAKFNGETILLKRGCVYFETCLIHSEIIESKGYEEEIMLLDTTYCHNAIVRLFYVYVQIVVNKLYVAQLPEEKIDDFFNDLSTLKSFDEKNCDSRTLFIHNYQKELYSNLFLSKYLHNLVLTDVSLPQNYTDHVLHFFTMLIEDKGIHHNVNFYADEMGISENRLRNIILSETHKAAVDWIKLFSVECYKYRLRSCSIPVKSIALEFGFEDPSSFQKFFKRHTGMTPSEYRETVYKRSTEFSK